MFYVLLSFSLSFIQNYIATLEVYNISRVRAATAATWATLNSLAAFAIVVLIVVESNRIPIVISCVIGDALATYIALKRVKRDH